MLSPIRGELFLLAIVFRSVTMPNRNETYLDIQYGSQYHIRIMQSLIDQRNFGKWWVSSNGYQWDREQGDWYLRPAGAPAPVREYFLMEEPGLFQTLGQIETEEKQSSIREAILDFANKHGILGREMNSLLLWREEIRRLRVGIDLWNGIRKNDTKLVSKHLRWVKTRAEEDEISFSYRLAGSGNEFFAYRYRLTPPDLLLPAWHALQTLINEELIKGVSPQVLFIARPRKAPTKSDNPKESPRSIRDVPRDLLGGCWLQLARAFEGNRTYKQCEAEGCRNWFETQSAAGGRADQKYCSDYCRVRAHRIRKAKGESK